MFRYTHPHTISSNDFFSPYIIVLISSASSSNAQGVTSTFSGCFVHKLVSAVKSRYVYRLHQAWISSHWKRNAKAKLAQYRPHKLNARTRSSGIAQLVTESLEEPIDVRAVEETPRGTILIIGSRAVDPKTCVKPTERARAARGLGTEDVRER